MAEIRSPTRYMPWGVAGLLAVAIGISYTSRQSPTESTEKNRPAAAQAVQDKRPAVSCNIIDYSTSQGLEWKAMRLQERKHFREALDVWKDYTLQAFLEGSDTPYPMLNMRWYAEAISNLSAEEAEQEAVISRAAFISKTIDEYLGRIESENPSLAESERRRHKEYTGRRKSSGELIASTCSGIVDVLQDGSSSKEQKAEKMASLQDGVGKEIFYQALQSVPNFYNMEHRLVVTHPEYESVIQNDPARALFDERINQAFARSPQLEDLRMYYIPTTPEGMVFVAAVASFGRQVEKHQAEKEYDRRIREAGSDPARHEPAEVDPVTGKITTLRGKARQPSMGPYPTLVDRNTSRDKSGTTSVQERYALTERDAQKQREEMQRQRRDADPFYKGFSKVHEGLDKAGKAMEQKAKEMQSKQPAKKKEEKRKN